MKPIKRPETVPFDSLKACMAMAVFLLCSAAAATTFSGTNQLKNALPTVETALFQQEMVAGFIVKPHAFRGKKLDAELAAHDASGLSSAAVMPMSVVRAMSGGAHVLRLQQPVPLSEARVIAARLMRRGSVELAEPDRIMYPATATPSDPGYSNQWHYMTPVGANKGGASLPAAWDITLGSSGVKVAVLDTGYRPHADTGTVLSGYDFITDVATANDGNGRDSDASDPGDWTAADECGDGAPASNSSWHGTHVAGTIAALMNNDKGGAGVAPNVKILPLRVLGKCGGRTSDIADAMRWAAGLGVPGVPAHHYVIQVLNMSLGGGGSCSSTFQSAVDDVLNAGKTIVVAAGNSGSTSLSQPANCTGVLAVTAHAIDGDNASYANIGADVFISAPGGGCGTLSNGTSCTGPNPSTGLAVYSNGNTGTTGPESDTYALQTGTSMATPHVAGTVALMLSLNGALTQADIRSYLQSSARSHPDDSTCTLPEYSGKCGAGLLDAGAALTLAASGIAYPAVNVSDPQVVEAGSVATLSASAVAPAGNTIVSYEWTASPSNPSAITLANANTQNASFTAPDTGNYAFTVTVTDSGGNAGTANTTVRVNTAPTLHQVAQQTVIAGNSLVFAASGLDIDGDSLIFHSLSLPAGASLSPSGVFSWPSATPVGSHQVTYYASDDYADSAVGTVSLVVTAPRSGGGGGGSMDGGSLLLVSLIAVGLRLRRAANRARGSNAPRSND